MRIGVVIPARDEAPRIGSCLASLRPFREAGDRVVVVDDGSTDDTADRARQGGAEVLEGERSGRGFAVARGVGAVAPGCDAVLIAHADMVVPPGAREAIARVLRGMPERPGGFLGHRIDAPGLKYRLLEAGNRVRAAAWGLAYGDQAIFITRAAIARIGGFPRCAVLEDLEMSLELRRFGPLADAGCPVLISPRHWESGVFRTTLRNWLVVFRFLRGRRPRESP